MRKRTILLVGDSTRELRDYLLEHGYEYIVLKDILLTKYPDKRLKRRVLCDFSSDNSIFDKVDELKAQHTIDGVMVVYENYVRPTAKIASHLNLPGIPIAAANACTDKFIMRTLFAQAPEKISPDFSVVTSETDVKSFAKSHSFPLILKPANLSKSLLVFKSNSLEELLDNYHKMLEKIDKVYARYAPHTKPKIIIEEFMVGDVQSVDAFVDSQGHVHVLDNIVDYQTGYDVGYDDNFHYSRLLPSHLPRDTVEQIQHVAKLGCEALGMANSPAHIEIILTSEGPMIVEIGARNGGYRERMHRLANDIDITGNAIRLAFGEQPLLQSKRNDSVGVFELFPKQPGNFGGITNETRLQHLPSFYYMSVKAKTGNFVGKSSDGYKACAVVILHNTNAERFANDVQYLNNKVAVVTS